MDEVDKARDWLIHNAEKCANAKANRTYAEEYRKSLKAILFNDFEGPATVRENLAYADKRYLDHLEVIRNAVFEDEHMKALKGAAEMKIEIWRTTQATLRAAKV